MKTSWPNAKEVRSRPRRARNETAFTMVEIAIALAVIGFALVAIIGVLPSGLEVQKDNREETIINQDAAYFMDAIRSGARGADDLTNYVLVITNSWQLYDTSTTPWTPQGNREHHWYSQTNSGSSIAPPPLFPLTNGYRIIGLLSKPKYQHVGGPVYRSNHVVAFVRSLSGPASEKFPQQDTAVRDLAFQYRLISEVVPVPAYDTKSDYGRNLQANLNEVRLLFRWPLFPNGNTGNGRQAYRSQVGGHHLEENDKDGSGYPVHFFHPTTFTNATPP